MANNNPGFSDLIRNSVKNAIASVADAGIKAATEKARQAVSEVSGVNVSEDTTQHITTPRNQLTSNKSSQAIVEVNDDDDDYIEVDDDGDDNLPMSFYIYDAKKNLECAAACYRIWGRNEEECDDVQMPHIVASNTKNALAFCGTIDELFQLCEHNGYYMDDWNVYGLEPNEENGFIYDEAVIHEIKVSKDTIKFVAVMMMSYDKSMDEQFRTNHVDRSKRTSVAKMAVNIPHLEGAPLAHFARPIAIIYEAVKDGVLQPYIHEFGENSDEDPMMLTLGGKDEKKSLVITGGDMDVVDGYIIH